MLIYFMLQKINKGSLRRARWTIEKYIFADSEKQNLKYNTVIFYLPPDTFRIKCFLCGTSILLLFFPLSEISNTCYFLTAGTHPLHSRHTPRCGTLYLIFYEYVKILTASRSALHSLGPIQNYRWKLW
jgi:hypothetical protein